MIVIPQQSSAMMRQFAAFGKPLQQPGLDAKANLVVSAQKIAAAAGKAVEKSTTGDGYCNFGLLCVYGLGYVTTSCREYVSISMGCAMLCSSSPSEARRASGLAECLPHDASLVVDAMGAFSPAHFHPQKTSTATIGTRPLSSSKSSARWTPLSIDVVTPFHDYERT